MRIVKRTRDLPDGWDNAWEDIVMGNCGTCKSIVLVPDDLGDDEMVCERCAGRESNDPVSCAAQL